MRKLLIALASTLLAAPLLAQQAGIPGAPVAARVSAGTYAVDPAHTQVRWRINHLGFSQFDGFFADPTGTLVIDPRRLETAQLRITLPIDRVVSTSAALDRHLKTKDFFDATKYPTATFVSTRVKPEGQRALITGNLTLHGVTRPVVLEARFIGAGNNPRGSKALNIGFEATTRISRSAFGMTYGVPALGDVVDLSINAAFEKQ